MPYHQNRGKKRGAHNNAQGGNGQEVAARKAEDPNNAEALITPENYAKRWPTLANECVEEHIFPLLFLTICCMMHLGRI